MLLYTAVLVQQLDGFRVTVAARDYQRSLAGIIAHIAWIGLS
jgi:hypothetical protein